MSWITKEYPRFDWLFRVYIRSVTVALALSAVVSAVALAILILTIGRVLP